MVDGELAPLRTPLIPGHEIVGRIDAVGAEVRGFNVGERVGIPWLGYTCGRCRYCSMQRETLCDHPLYTGFTRDGGYATAVVADARFVFALGERGADTDLAPLLCAGLVGWRALHVAGKGRTLGLYGFGAAAQVVAQIAIRQRQSVYAFSRPGDIKAQQFALELGADWAGGSDEQAPQQLDAAIIFAPVGTLVPQALRSVRKGGRVVCSGAHMTDVPSFPYQLLAAERQLMSVANPSRQDGIEFFKQVPQLNLRMQVTRYALQQANQALGDLRDGKFEGAAVLAM